MQQKHLFDVGFAEMLSTCRLFNFLIRFHEIYFVLKSNVEYRGTKFVLFSFSLSVAVLMKYKISNSLEKHFFFLEK